jgi:hypothetical protein
MKKVSGPQVVTTVEASESPLPAEIQEALGELVGAAREGLLSVAGHRGWGAGGRRGDPDHRRRGDRRPRRLVPGAPGRVHRRDARGGRPLPGVPAARHVPRRRGRRDPCGSPRCRASSTKSRGTAS